MKKKIILLLLLLCLTGCGNTTENISENNEIELSKTIEIDDTGASLVCTNDTIYEEENYSIGSKYVIYLNNDNFVTRINSVEIIETNDQEKLSYFESYLNNNYSKISAYSGYEYDINIENNHLISNVNINYEEFNLESYAVDYPEIEKFLTDNKISKDKLIEHFSSLDIKCEKK